MQLYGYHRAVILSFALSFFFPFDMYHVLMYKDLPCFPCCSVIFFSSFFSVLLFFITLQGIADSVVELEARSSGTKEVLKNQHGVVGMRKCSVFPRVFLCGFPPFLPDSKHFVIISTPAFHVIIPHILPRIHMCIYAHLKSVHDVDVLCHRSISKNGEIHKFSAWRFGPKQADRAGAFVQTD